jgi:Beta/Gamma crystallin
MQTPDRLEGGSATSDTSHPFWRNIVAHAILFEHADFRGAHKHVFMKEDDLGKWWDNTMNDVTSSIVILEGRWEFFKDNACYQKLGPTLGPGSYPNVDSALGAGAGDQISSLRPA